MITDGTLNFKDNIIEQSYQNDWNILNEINNFSTQSWIKLETQYTSIWDIELNSFYQRLIKNISPDKQSLLIESQRAWLDYYIKEEKLLSKLLLEESLNGSGGYALFHTKLLKEKKKRAYELLEYCYMLGIETSFLYK